MIIENDLFYETKLDPCPRCGGYAAVDEYKLAWDGYKEVSIRCTKCGLTMTYKYNGFDDHPVCVAWGYRPNSILSVRDTWKSYMEVINEAN